VKGNPATDTGGRDDGSPWGRWGGWGRARNAARRFLGGDWFVSGIALAAMTCDARCGGTKASAVETPPAAIDKGCFLLYIYPSGAGSWEGGMLPGVFVSRPGTKERDSLLTARSRRPILHRVRKRSSAERRAKNPPGSWNQEDLQANARAGRLFPVRWSGGRGPDRDRGEIRLLPGHEI
jgi:hypothetical protein